MDKQKYLKLMEKVVYLWETQCIQTVMAMQNFLNGKMAIPEMKIELE